MGARVTIGGSGTLFVGEDKTFLFEVLTAVGVPVDMAGWSVMLVVRTKAGNLLVSKAATITGVYNATRATNTQRATVTLTDTEMAIAPGTHVESLKRIDDGEEAILTYGDFIAERATQT